MDGRNNGIDGLERGVDNMLEKAIEWLPQLFGALVIILIGHWIAKAVAQIVRRMLTGAQLDARVHASQGGSLIQRAVPSPTNLIDRLTYWLLFVGAVSLGASVLGIDALNRFIGAIYGYIPQVVAAVAIFLIGSAVAAGVTTLVRNTMGDTPTGKLVESILPVIVIGITVFMILDQLGVAPTIVTITYAALLGSVALGSALAFGLGGQQVAARMLEQTYEKGKQSAGQAKKDLNVGKERIKEQAKSARR